MSLVGAFGRSLINSVMPLGTLVAGNAVDLAGTALHLPEMGISEHLAGGNTLNTNKVASGTYSQPTQQGVLGAQTSTTPYGPDNPNLPQTGSFGSTPTKIAPTGATPMPTAPAIPDNSLQLLQANYANARGDLTNQADSLDASNLLAQRDINNGIDQTTKAGETQKTDLSKQFGDILAQQLRTYQDLGRQRQGLFSNLGTLDSSAFGEQQFRADQALANDSLNTDTEKVKALKSVDDAVSAYSQKAQSQLGQLAIQYDRGKQAIQKALMDGNLQEANGIQQQIDALKSRATEIQTNAQNWATQMAALKSQGYDVSGILKQINGNNYQGQVNNQLASAQQGLQSIMPSLTAQPQQQFMGKSGKKYGSLSEMIQSGDF